MTMVSLHLPKTAGTSFSAALAAHFGDRYVADYGDQAISRPPDVRNSQALAAGRDLAEQGLGDVACVHGHFLPVKYLALAERHPVTFVTWMREPVARMLSHYHYWLESYDPASAAPHHRQFIEEGWTLERFCLSEAFRNIYSQYLWGFPLENFAFIGISEHYREDLRDFSQRYFSTELEPLCRNVTARRSPRQVLGGPLLEKVRAFHAADIELYERALRLRQARRANIEANTRDELAAH